MSSSLGGVVVGVGVALGVCTGGVYGVGVALGGGVYVAGGGVLSIMVTLPAFTLSIGDIVPFILLVPLSVSMVVGLAAALARKFAVSTEIPPSPAGVYVPTNLIEFVVEVSVERA